MKRTLLAAILATAAIAFSCTMEEKGSLQSASVVTEPVVTVADFVAVGAATKTTAEYNDNKVTFAFAEGDVLRAYPVAPEVGDGLRFTVKENKGTSCVFTGSGFGLKEGQKYAAYYPGGDDEVPAVNAVPVSFLGQSQPAADVWNLSNVDFLYNTGVEPENGACSFSMKHLGALLVISVTFEEAGVYKALTIETTDLFVTAGTVDLTADDPAAFFVPDDDTLAETITLTLGGDSGMAVEANQTVNFYMMMAPDDLQADADLTVTITDVNDKVTTLKEGKGFAFESGKAYKFGSTVEAPLPGINLSANGTANCYIVSEAGDYYFDASVVGNGAAGVMPDDVVGNIYPAVGTYKLPYAVSTNVPVQTEFNENDCLSAVSYDPEHKVIRITATGNEGNAKISIRSDDPNVPQWTWHIWCTDQPATVTYSAPDSPNNTFTIMDRNLGATMASMSEVQSESDIPKICGLYYQWGRPTPLRGSEASFGGDANLTHAFTFWYPNFIHYSGASDYAFFNWRDETVGGFNKASAASLWGNNNNVVLTWRPVSQISKTIYDPCPPGYQVAPTDFLRNFTNTDADALTADAHGFTLAGNDGDVYFPYNGKCNANGLCARWDNARMVNITDENGGNDGCSIVLWTSGSGGGCTGWRFLGNFNENWKVDFNLGTQAGYYPCGVRCVAEK